MIHGRINDNHPSRGIREVFKPLPKDASAVDLFCRELGGRSLSDLRKNNPRLLIFPCDFDAVEDDIEKLSIFHLNGDNLSTGNVMGFVGKGGVSLSISSRFYPDSNDFFLHYLLQKVVGFHVVDLPTTQGQDSIWDFLPYLFPSYFMAAWKQGIFKVNQRFKANDDHLRGAIDIAQHIRHNIPFRGKIAYVFSERSPVNPVNQLIRLTIDVLEHSSRFKAMFHGENKAFNDAIRDLKLLVPLEAMGSNSKIIKENLRPIVHPFYLKYRPLQQLCLAILRHEKITLGEEDEEVVGVLFDGAWLWEEYVAKIMPQEITHAQNKQRLNGFMPARNWGCWYPDFYKKNTLVLDAKYKNPDAKEFHRADRHQIVAYMHTLKADRGGFIYPGKDAQKCEIDKVTLSGYGGTVYQLQIPIPSQAPSYPDFMASMRRKEEEFMRLIEDLLAKDENEVNPRKR